MKKILFVGLIAVISLAFLVQNSSVKKITTSIQNNISNQTTDNSPDQEILAQDLEIPWEVVILPSGERLITERPGRLLKIGADRKVIEVSGVRHIGEGGLLGMVLDPQFESNNFIYLYLTSDSGGRISNRVERYVFQDDSLMDRKIILDGIAGSSVHDGGRIAFGPDGFLYVTTGDAGTPSLAQNKNSLNGKILRIKADGSVPTDNPFGNAVYSYGHRNVQGITWEESGQLWATEHGRSGIQSGLDELNRIEKGGNYGWPTIQGDETRTGMITPIIHSGSSETWAPAGMEFVNGSIFFAGLRGSTLYEYTIQSKSLTKHLEDVYGRLRTVKRAEDGFLYILTNNRDGRGVAKEGDDKLLKIRIEKLN